MTYDKWKTTNPEDEWLGPEPGEEDEPEPDDPAQEQSPAETARGPVYCNECLELFDPKSPAASADEIALLLVQPDVIMVSALDKARAILAKFEVRRRP